MEHRPTRPNESAFAFSSERIEATPTPSAMMNGTVIGPVVTPPESNATARMPWSDKNAARNTSA